MFRKALKQRNCPRAPLTKIIMKRTKLHVKQQRTKPKKGSYRQSKGLRLPIRRTGYHRRTEVLRTAKERDKKSNDIYQSKLIKDEEDKEC